MGAHNIENLSGQPIGEGRNLTKQFPFHIGYWFLLLFATQATPVALLPNCSNT